MINLRKYVLLVMAAIFSVMVTSAAHAEVSVSSSQDEMTASESIPTPQAVPVATAGIVDKAVISESIPTPQAVPVATAGIDKIIGSERMNISAFVGNSKLIKFTDPVSRVAVGDQDIVDFRIISPSEILILGKAVGTTNIILWHKNGKSTLVDASISVDLSQFEKLLRTEFPRETDIHLNLASASIVLAGSVSDALTAEAVVGLAEAHVRNLNRYLMKGGGGSGGGSGGGAAAVPPSPSTGADISTSSTQVAAASEPQTPKNDFKEINSSTSDNKPPGLGIPSPIAPRGGLDNGTTFETDKNKMTG